MYSSAKSVYFRAVDWPEPFLRSDLISASLESRNALVRSFGDGKFLDGVFVLFSCSDTKRLLDGEDEDLSIADLSGKGILLNRFNDPGS